MEEERLEPTKNEEISENEGSVYTPRPAWQVWAARIGLVIMLIAIALYYYHIARGGL